LHRKRERPDLLPLQQTAILNAGGGDGAPRTMSARGAAAGGAVPAPPSGAAPAPSGGLLGTASDVLGTLKDAKSVADFATGDFVKNLLADPGKAIQGAVGHLGNLLGLGSFLETVPGTTQLGLPGGAAAFDAGVAAVPGGLSNAATGTQSIWQQIGGELGRIGDALGLGGGTAAASAALPAGAAEAASLGLGSSAVPGIGFSG